MNTNFYTVNDYNLPVSLSKAKAFLRITHNDDDDLITHLIKSAINYAENKFNIVLGKKDYECKFFANSQTFEIPKPNLIKVNFVKINEIEMEYIQEKNTIIFNDTAESGTICINFTCENNHFGQALETAILRHVFYLYENRSNTENSINIEQIYNHLIENNYKI